MTTRFTADLFDKLSARRQKRAGAETTVRNGFATVLIVGAIALPIFALTPGAAHAETLKEITTRGIVLSMAGMDVDVKYTPDGKFSAMEGQVTGTWRIDGETLCVTSNFQPTETCTLYPRDKKSGDTFDLVTNDGVVQIRIK
jgi:hypothetical protein